MLLTLHLRKPSSRTLLDSYEEPLNILTILFLSFRSFDQFKNSCVWNLFLADKNAFYLLLNVDYAFIWKRLCFATLFWSPDSCSFENIRLQPPKDSFSLIWFLYLRRFPPHIQHYIR